MYTRERSPATSGDRSGGLALRAPRVNLRTNFQTTAQLELELELESRAGSARAIYRRGRERSDWYRESVTLARNACSAWRVRPRRTEIFTGATTIITHTPPRAGVHPPV